MVIQNCELIYMYSNWRRDVKRQPSSSDYETVIQLTFQARHFSYQDVCSIFFFLDFLPSYPKYSSSQPDSLHETIVQKSPTPRKNILFRCCNVKKTLVPKVSLLRYLFPLPHPPVQYFPDMLSFPPLHDPSLPTPQLCPSFFCLAGSGAWLILCDFFRSCPPAKNNGILKYLLSLLVSREMLTSSPPIKKLLLSRICKDVAGLSFQREELCWGLVVAGLDRVGLGLGWWQARAGVLLGWWQARVLEIGWCIIKKGKAQEYRTQLFRNFNISGQDYSD